MNIPRLTSLEILEDRIAPAGVITLTETAPGVVTITGDALANDITVLQALPGVFRFEPAPGTTLNVTGTGVVSSYTTNKLTSLTAAMGGDADELILTNLTTLTALTVDGGAGSDDFFFTNLGVKGDATVNTGDGNDDIEFLGLSTAIKGNLNLGFGANGTDVEFLAEKTNIGGTLRIVGGTGAETISASGAGSITIGKGIESNAGASGLMTFNFDGLGVTALGKLPTGESMLLQGAGGHTASFSRGDLTLAGGVRFTGGALGDSVLATNASGNIKIGKLPSGESFLFDGNAGFDQIDLEGMNISLAGGVRFNSGNDGSEIRLVSPDGKVSVGKMASGHSIELTGDSGNQLIRLDALKATLSGGIELNGAGGANTIQLFQLNGVAAIGKLPGGESIKHTGGIGADTITLNAGTVTLAGAIDFAPGDGTNAINRSTVSGSLKIGKDANGASIRYAGGAGADEVDLDAALLALAGGVDFNGGSGGNALDFFGTGGKFTVGKLATGQSVRFLGGTGGDSIDTEFLSVALAGGIEFSAGDGSNRIDFNGEAGSVKVGKLFTGQSLLYLGGAGTDSVDSSEALTQFAGGIELNGGDGSNEIRFDGDGVVKIGTIATGQSIKFTGGAGGDDILLGGKSVTLSGSVELTGGDDNNVIDLDGMSVNIGKTAAGISISLIGGADQESIDIEGIANIAGSITLDGGSGDDRLDLGSVLRLKVGGAVTFTGGPDNDDFNFEVFSLAIAQGITFNGGDGTDTFNLNADGTVGGDVNIDLGAATAGEQEAILTSRNGTVGGLRLNGGLSITSTGTAATTDFVELTNINVAKIISATLGAGGSEVNIDNLFGGSFLDINAGDGADTINFERLDLFGNSVITKLATILTGGGDDFLLIGTPLALPGAGLLDSTRVRFLSGLGIDGGAGTNTRNDIATENTIGGSGVTGLGTFTVIVP